MAGRRVRCKNCGTTFALTAPAPTPAEDDDAPIGMARDDDDYGVSGAAAPIDVAPPEEDLADTPERAFNEPPALQADEDVDSVFEDAFQSEYAPSRGNTPFVFPGSRQLDQWLPTILIVICVPWLIYLCLFASADMHQAWVGVVRFLVLMMTYAGVVFPICLRGVRMSARKLNYELPSGAAFRAFSTFLLPVTIGCAIWLSSASVAGFVFGVAMGLIVAMPTMWLLFRIRQDDAGVSLGYGAGAFGVGVLAAAVLLIVLNLIIVGVIRGSKAEHTLTASPFGPGFTWDGPTLVEKPIVVAKKPKRGEPVAAATTGRAFDSLPDNPNGTTRPSDTQPAVAESTTPPAPPESTGITAIDTAAATDPAANPAVIEKPVKLIEHNAIVTDVTERISGDMVALLYPTLPGQAVAVVKKGTRQAEDRVELWTGRSWTMEKSTAFIRGEQASDHYQLSPDGKMLARLSEFPHLSAQVHSFAINDLIRPFVKIESGGTQPYLAGFAVNNALTLFFSAGEKSSVELWDVDRVKRKLRFDVNGLRTDRGSYAFSRDGKFLALVLWQNGDANGRIETYNLTTGALQRKIVIDELEWNFQVRCTGLAFTDESDKVAALFERQGQGLFLVWGANNDIPLHQHVYPGGLVPENVIPGNFRGPSFSLIDNSRAWLLYGASVFDTATGKLLGDLGIKNVVSQRPLSADSILLLQNEGATSSLLEAKLDLGTARRELAAKP